MTKTIKDKNKTSRLFVVIKNSFVALSVLLLLHRAIDYVSSFFPALHEAYSSLPVTNLDLNS